jgi:AcrR family transcriptional regulator
MTPDTGTKRSSNKRGSGGHLREEIVAAAEQLLAASGSSEAVTLRAIARQAGIAAPSIYPHFADRDAILDVVVNRAFETLARTCRDAAVGQSPGVAEIEAIATAYVGFARDHPGRYRILFERSSANIASPPRQYDEGIDAFGLLVEAVGRALLGVPADDQQPMLDAQTLFVALHGIATLPRALPAFRWLDEAALIRNAVTRIIGDRSP